MKLIFRKASIDDIPDLAAMNRQLIIDEQSHSMMTEPELLDRMRGWIDEGRTALLIERGEEVIGYMLYYRHDDEFYPYLNSIYVRQFFIKNSYRRRGFGQEAFRAIVAEYFPPDTAITLDVVATNIAARQFWEKLGFNPYHVSMRREANGAATNHIDIQGAAQV